jgi:hypothetical protein
MAFRAAHVTAQGSVTEASERSLTSSFHQEWPTMPKMMTRAARLRRSGAALLAAAALTLTLGAVPAAAASPAGVDRVAAAAAAKAPAAKKYANCTALNRVYPHGVGKSGAVDRVAGKTKPVRNFTKNNAVYAANAKSDRDKDGLACEKR